jgi:hypothetical protein
MNVLLVTLVNVEEYFVRVRELSLIGDKIFGDPHRRQVTLPALRTSLLKRNCPIDRHEAIAAIDELIAEVKRLLYERFADVAISEGVVIRSTVGGTVQDWHRDFEMRASLVSEPVGLLIPLSCCRLDFLCLSDRSVTTPTPTVGDLLMFRGHAVHRGCVYDATNYRIHFYVVHVANKELLLARDIVRHTELFTLHDVRDVPSLFDKFAM